MKYLVMETHLSYAVVLDEKGNFLKVCNMNYEPGDEVVDVIRMKEEEKTKVFSFTSLKPALGLAASFLFISLIIWQLFFFSIGAIGININPSVRLEINRVERVLEAVGTNNDGITLLEGLDIKGMPYDEASVLLAKRAYELGMLEDGSQVRLDILKGKDAWSEQALTKISDRLSETITINIEIIREQEFEPIVIPIEPRTTEPEKEEEDESETPSGVDAKPEPVPTPVTDDLSDYDDYTDYDDHIDDYTDYSDDVDDYSDYSDDYSDYEDDYDDVSDYEYEEESDYEYDDSDYDD